MQPGQLSELQLDAIREICNIGIGHATTALSLLLGSQVEMGMPSVHQLSLSSLHDFIGGGEVPAAGVLLAMGGDAQGMLMLLFPHDCALRLIGHLTGHLTGRPAPQLLQLNELESSAIKEVGHILVASCLNAISALLNLALVPSVPTLSLDMAGAMLDPILSCQCLQGDRPLLVQATFSAQEGSISGRFFLVPDPASLQVILTAAGLAHA